VIEARTTPRMEPLLAWPGMASLRFSLPLSYLFFKIFFYVYGATSLLAKFRNPQPGFYFPWEMRLPFVPAASLIYLSVPLVLILTPFILRTWRSFTPFFLTLTFETLIAGIFFLLIPTAQGYPERVAYGFFGGVFRLADRINLEYNEFPSLHVAFAVTAAWVFGRRCGWLGRTFFTLWAVAVGVSTLLIHEHHLLDLAGGLILGLASVTTIQRRVSREDVLEAVRVEALCLREFAWFTRRHVRYLFVFFALFKTSLGRWRETRVLRAAYCLAQHVDDVLDGDRRIKGIEPEAYVGAVLRGLRGEAPFGETIADQLAEFVAPRLTAEARRELIELFEVLLEDRRRMDARRVTPAADLAGHHRKTFFLSLDLTFQLAGAGLRAGDAPELVDALSWCSPVRDLGRDLEKGLINLPAEVIAEAGWAGKEANLTPLLDTPAVREWLRGEHRRGAAAIEALGARLDGVADPRGRAILSLFHRALAAFERKYRRKHPAEPPVSTRPRTLETEAP
jgi:membrane-associated phospholipid phosphatase